MAPVPYGLLVVVLRHPAGEVLRRGFTEVPRIVYRSLGKPYLLLAREGSAVIVCHCSVVNDRAVTDAIDAGARTLAGVCAATGAGRDCGSCVFSVKRVMCEHEPAVHAGPVGPAFPAARLEAQEVQVAAS